MSVAYAVALAGALAATAYAGSGALLAWVVVAQVLLVVDWHRAIEVPGAVGGGLLALAAGVASGVAVIRSSTAASLSAATGVLGIASVGVLVHQLLRPDRSRVMASMSATGTLIVLTALTVFYLPVNESDAGSALVAVVAAAVAAAQLVGAFRLPVRAATLAAAGAGAVAGLAAGALADTHVLAALVAGVAAGALSSVADGVAERSARPAPWLAPVLALAFGGPVAHVVARLVES